MEKDRLVNWLEKRKGQIKNSEENNAKESATKLVTKGSLMMLSEILARVKDGEFDR